MAERLEEFEFSGQGPKRKYPWDEWMDGSIWRITRGVDFQTEPRAFRPALFIHAKRHGHKMQTQIDGDSITFQATSVEADSADR